MKYFFPSMPQKRASRMSAKIFLILCAVFGVTFSTHAATTIGLNITTGGTLSVTGHSTFSTTQMTGLRLSTGAALGRIMQSDASGNASWVTPSSVLGSADLDDLSDVSVGSAVTGDLLYFNGTNWVNLADGNAGQVLTSDGAGGLSWTSVSGGHDAVTLAGTYDYLTLSGQQITLNQIDLTTDVTGVLPDANVSDTLTIGASSTVADAALSSNVSLLGQTIESSEITNGTILFEDLGQNGCGVNEIIKWNGTTWQCATDNTGGGGANSFETMSTPAGTSPVADSATDTLTWVEGLGITITGNAVADSITIGVSATTTGTTSEASSNSGIEVTSGGIRLLGGCVDNEILKWDAGTSEWACSADESATFASLDDAYNNGSAITVDGSAITLTIPDGSNNSGLIINHNDETNDLPSIVITAATGADITALDLTDADILYALDLGGNSIRVNSTTVTAAELAVLAGGIDESEVIGVITDVTAGNGLSGGGASGAVTLDIALDTTADDGATTSSISGLEFDGNGQLSLIRGCAEGQVLKWNNTSFEWACANDADTAVTADSLDFSEFADAMTVDANTSIDTNSFGLSITGAGTFSVNTTGAVSIDTSGALTLGTTNASGITIGRTGATTTLQGDVDVAEYIDFNTTGAPAYQMGRVFYDTDEHSLAYYNDVNGITVNIGQEHLQHVKNETGSTLLEGQVVYINGSEIGSDVPTVALARADAHLTAQAIGIMTHDLANNQTGYATMFGQVHGLDTSLFAEGDPIYLSETTAGAFTTTAPVAPNHAVPLGWIMYAHAVDGVILVNVTPALSGNMTPGSVVFGESTGMLSQDNTNLYWDDVNNRLGIGDNTPTATLTVGAGDQFRVIGATGDVTMNGDLTFTSGGGTAISSGGDLNVDSIASLNLGATNATAISLGRTGITTTNNGSLTVTELLTANAGATMSGGTINLNVNSNFDTNINTGTSTGAVSIGNASSGAITLTAGAASTWSTASGALTIDSAAALNVGTTNATSVVIGNVANTTSISLLTDGTGDGELTVPTGSISGTEITDGTITPVDLNYTGSLTDEFCLTYESGTGSFEWQSCAGASGNTLDLAYDQGGAGAGRSITADSGAVEITVPDTSNNAALILNQNDTTNNPAAFIITNTGTGNDITGSNFSFAQAGTLTITPTLANGITLAPYGTGAGNTTEMRFAELVANGSNYVGFKAPDSLAGNTIYTLPSADGTSGQVLQTNGAGVTSWVTPTTGGATSANYVFAYDTTAQAVATANVWQTITFANRPRINGWTYNAGTGDFTAPETGLYLVSYAAEVGRNNNGDTTVSVRATNGGVEIPGSVFSSSPARARAIGLSNSFIAQLTAGDLMRFQVTSATTGNDIGLFIPTGGNGTVQPTITLTIIRIN